MDNKELLNAIEKHLGNIIKKSSDNGQDELYLETDRKDFKALCLFLHKKFTSPAMMFFCSQEAKVFRLTCVFQDTEFQRWVSAVVDIPENELEYETLSKQMHSAALFEREIYESFGIKAKGSPDLRRLNLHDEVWPEGNYPLKKEFDAKHIKDADKKPYVFKRIEGEGMFEVPVGPVHAGIIAPGHFRFSVAGEPIINLEIRLGFKHRGIEKLFENKNPHECIELSECVSGDSSFAHSLAFCQAVEKISSLEISEASQRLRCIYLELERMYNHAGDAGAIALDVGFTFAANYSTIIKEKILAFNEKLSGSRYLKGVNKIGGVSKGINDDTKKDIVKFLDEIRKEFLEFKGILLESVSFMDRVDTTGRLGKTIAQDLGVVGLCAKASGINRDLRKDFKGIYNTKSFSAFDNDMTGDVLSRLKVRFFEFEESINIIKSMLEFPLNEITGQKALTKINEGYAIGSVEAWRGPVLYWVKIDKEGKIDRCKIVDPSFHNWQGLSYAVKKNIIPDFPVCNKSFNLSYSGNDL
jgi:Ni,Fe-hydrogenase III large subunit/Ni,Fe-hydrogenase III component G